MSQPTAGAACEAASVLSNLPEYEVLEVTRDELAGRMVMISTPIGDAACPDCGVLTRRVHPARATRSFAWLRLPFVAQRAVVSPFGNRELPAQAERGG